MDTEQKQILQKVADTVRILSMDAVQKANSGHPGLPLGCAEIGAYLWGHQMRYNSKDSNWLNRDRFVLSAGHGCMLQYSLLHLSGYKLSLDDIKNFRQLHSKTPGHPEYSHTDGIEVTTGPLGQGVANAVGLALGFKLLSAKFNNEQHKILDNKVFCLAGDGCIMEGVSSESSCFAGHLGLDNLILIYDSNHICLDGPLNECCSEDTKLRYKGYGFDVFEIDGYDFDAMDEVFSELRKNQKKPALVILHTVIGKGSPHKAGSHKAHGSPLGADEVKATKEALGLPLEEFYIPQAVVAFFESHREKLKGVYDQWKKGFENWAKNTSKLYQDLEAMASKRLPDDLEDKLKKLEIEDPIAGRSASQAVIVMLADLLPQIYGGSADLSGSDMTMIKQFPIVSPGNFSGRNMKYGVREFGMAGITAGLFRTGLITPFCGTFFTFSDYMRNAIRLAALSKYQVVYQFTHDSIFLGEDGPTHQPVEHLMSLRAMPNLQLFRPADTNETKMSWLAALNYEGPSAIILTRQKLANLPHTEIAFKDGVGRGAYIILKEEKEKPDVTLFGTGSEVSLAVDVAEQLKKMGKSVRVVSMPCWEIFDNQDEAYQESVVGGDLGIRVSIETGVDQGWYKYIGREGLAICMESFGASAPASVLAPEFGFTADQIVERILNG
ncbi:MAG: Transketolase [Chlamydiae bacterium]|nr:Transketolase [Chlamydiota bacterium]